MGNRLTEYLEDNLILSDFQFGFRKKHSTEHPLVLFLNKISEAINKKESTISIFCDLQKAFDTCDHGILLKKLSNVGIRGANLEWFKNYLQDRHQFVSVGGVSSSKRSVRRGVPQGSVFGSTTLSYIYKWPAVCLFPLLAPVCWRHHTLCIWKKYCRTCQNCEHRISKNRWILSSKQNGTASWKN